MLQLNPPIPVLVTSKENRRGRAIFIIDYSSDDHLIWVVAMDDSGEVWCVPNPEIRIQENWTMGRRYKKTIDVAQYMV